MNEKNKIYLNESERLLELINDLNYRNSGKFFIIFVVPECRSGEVWESDCCREFKNTLWKKLRISRYQAASTNKFAVIKLNRSENRYMIQCRSRRDASGFVSTTSNSINICFPVAIECVDSKHK